MAVTKIHPIKTTLKKAMDYICNPNKTDKKILISSYACAAETADIEFEITSRFAQSRSGGVLARHLMQAFEPDEITSEKAHELGKQLADEVLGGKYEYVLTTHIDKGHIHNHIIFNNVDMLNHKRYNSNKRSYHLIQKTSDRICLENGLSVIKNPVAKNISREEYQRRKECTSWKEKLQTSIDQSIQKSKSIDDLIKNMKQLGYEVKQGKYIAFRAQGQERFTRTKTLGEDYLEEAIKERMAGTHIVKKRPIQNTRKEKKRNTYYKTSIVKINLITNIRFHAKAKSRSYLKWASVRNIKELTNTINFLTVNEISNYQQIRTKVIELENSFTNVEQGLKEVELKLKSMGKIIGAAEKYKALFPVQQAFEKAKNREKYFEKHERELIIFKAAKAELDELKADPFINLGKLKADYGALEERKNNVYFEFRSLRKQLNNFKNAKINIDQILSRSTSRRQKIKYMAH